MVRARYVVGADGARSAVREAIGCEFAGEAANHAWGVMDVLADTDFPDIRTKCAIQSAAAATSCSSRARGATCSGCTSTSARSTPGRPRRPQHADRGDHRQGQRDPAPVHARREARRLAQRLRGGPPAHRPVRRRARREVGTRTPARLHRRRRLPHAQRQGRAGHERLHAGRLQPRLEARPRARRPQPRSRCSRPTPPSARWSRRDLIDFDKEWSSLMATQARGLPDPPSSRTFYVGTAEFPAGFMTQYAPSMLVAEPTHQELATGFPVGKRFKSAPVVRVCDTNPMHLGHHAPADGRWRIYVFADAAAAGQASALTDWPSGWPTHRTRRSRAHPGRRSTPTRASTSRSIYQQRLDDVDLAQVPRGVPARAAGPFRPHRLREGLRGAARRTTSSTARGIDRDGARRRRAARTSTSPPCSR